MKIVVKVGSSSLHNGIKPRLDVMQSIADQVSGLIADGETVTIVTSGAIAFGRSRFAGSIGEETIPTKQALAALGQPLLMDAWRRAFSKSAITVGQVLVTNQELFGVGGEKSHLLDTFCKMFDMGIVPIVNENDAVAIDQIVQGDNDTLSAHLANLIGASKLFLLGTASALYRDYPKNTDRIKVVQSKDIKSAYDYSHNTFDLQATGGMKTKIDAAIIISKLSASSETFMYIACASEPASISLANRGSIGTKFVF